MDRSSTMTKISSWFGNSRVGPSSSRVHTIGRTKHREVPRKTHIEMQNEIHDTFIQTPDYSINNIAGYDGVTGKLTLLGHLFKWGSGNTLLTRGDRFLREELYVVNCDRFDKINSIAILISAIIAMIIYFRSVSLNARQEYVFVDPEDNHDPEKVQNLKYYNEQWSTTPWLMGRTFLMAVPGMIAMWQIFKRTSVHRKGFEVRQETIRNDSRFASQG